jgi:hypothetical protein
MSSELPVCRARISLVFFSFSVPFSDLYYQQVFYYFFAHFEVGFPSNSSVVFPLLKRLLVSLFTLDVKGEIRELSSPSE